MRRVVLWPVLSLSLAWLAPAVAQAGGPALPTGGAVTAGTAQIGAPVGGALTITQTSSRAVIDWSSFSIGAGGQVAFANGSGATLNRVMGPAPSTLDGLLTATGSVYLINPAGVIVGKGGVVKTGGSFVASTLNLTDQAFMAGGDLTLSGASSASVVNLGQIDSLGGDVVLVARTVDNEGQIDAAQGDAGLLAGSAVELRDQALDGGRFVVSVGGAGTSVSNSGAIQAAVAELRANGGNVYALAGNTSGIISATGVRSDQGQVFLTAEDGGLSLDGVIQARGPGGAGGAIETSASTVTIGAARIDAGAGGTWTLDPDDLTIDQTAATTLASSLNAGTNVVQQTTASGSGGYGDIFVSPNVALAWTTAASLTLSAYRNISIGAGAQIASSGAGAVTLQADNTGTGFGAISFGPGARITTAGPVSLFYDPSVNPAGSGVNPWSYVDPSENYAPYVSGGGTLTAYMLVNSLPDLQDMQNNLSGTYALGADIAADATHGWSTGGPIASGFTPIGSYATPFTGVLNGQGHFINNMLIYQPTGQFVGLFGATYAATIENLTLANGSTTGLFATGGLIGYANGGTITNVVATTPIYGGTGAQYVGGLIGYDLGVVITSVGLDSPIVVGDGADAVGGFAGLTQYSDISLSSAAGTVTAGMHATNIGGFVGQAVTTTIKASYDDGAVTTGPLALNVGGLIGQMSGGEVDQTSADRPVSVSGPYLSVNIGGLIGLVASGQVLDSHASEVVDTETGAGSYDSVDVGGLVGANDGVIFNSYATGSVLGVSAVGGLVGDNEGSIGLSYATGTVQVGATDEFSYSVGGLVGYNTGSIGRSYATGSVYGASTYGSTYVGGLVGEDQGGQISGDYATGVVYSGGSFFSQLQFGGAGGLVGYGLNDSIDQSYATGAVTGVAGIGGLVGYAQAASVTRDYATGAVSGGGGPYTRIGGLVGYASATTISDDYATGLVTTGEAQAAGGLVGWADGGQITYAYATGAVEGAGSLYIGGLVGYADGGTIQQAYATGAVTGDVGATGGLLGGASSETITAAYWDLQTTGQSTSAGGQGLPTPDFFDTADLPGFSFGTTPDSDGWVIVDGDGSLNNGGGAAGGTRPILLLEYSTTIVNAHQLQLMALVPSGAYGLSADIDASATNGAADPSGLWSAAGFVPVGSYAAPFTGQLDGLDHTINGLTIDRPSGQFQGLFGSTYAATVENLTLTNASVTGDYVVGAVVGYDNGGTFDNVQSVAGQVQGGAGAADVGGLIGYALGTTLTAPTASGAVTAGAGAEDIGGLIGQSAYGLTQNATVSVNVTVGPGSAWIGGLVGEAGSTTIFDSTASGSVTVGYGSTGIGGLVGWAHGSSQIDAGRAMGTVQQAVDLNMLNDPGTSDLGGLVGEASGSVSILGGEASGSVDGGGVYSVNIGGLVGLLSGGGVSSAIATGSVDGATNVGGLVGQAQGAGVYDSIAEGNVFGLGPATMHATNGSQNIGGLVGWMDGGVLGGGQASGSVTGGAASAAVGGLVGAARSVNVMDSLATGPVSGFEEVGGLVGDLYAGEISYSTAKGATSGVGVGDADLGGLAGDAHAGAAIFGSFAIGAVTGGAQTAYAGGLVGQLEDSEVTLSAASGSVTVGASSQYVGGLIGDLDISTGSNFVSSSFALGPVTAGANSYSLGGLAGGATGSTITGAYAMGSVTGGAGSSQVGGLVGAIVDTSLDQTYAVGAVSGGSTVGGLVGTSLGSTVTASYWDLQTTGQSASAGGSGLLTAVFLATLPPGFTPSAWGQIPGVTYPYLPQLPPGVVPGS